MDSAQSVESSNDFRSDSSSLQSENVNSPNEIDTKIEEHRHLDGINSFGKLDQMKYIYLIVFTETGEVIDHSPPLRTPLISGEGVVIPAPLIDQAIQSEIISDEITQVQLRTAHVNQENSGNIGVLIRDNGVATQPKKSSIKVKTVKRSRGIKEIDFPIEIIEICH